MSANNKIKTNSRASLTLPTENKYLYIYFNLSSLHKWNPRRAVKHWITAKERRQVQTSTSTEKSTKKRYLKAVFAENQCESDDEDEESDKNKEIYSTNIRF